MFLDSVREKQEEEERQRKEKDGEEVRSFKECVAYDLDIPIRSQLPLLELLPRVQAQSITLLP